MPRKGNKKVRTGCKTCKIRKVKCDEEKPACKRCTATGRTCDGYDSTPEPGILYPVPIAPVPHARLPLRNDCTLVMPALVHRQRNILPMLPSKSPDLESSQARALQFFGCVVAPTLSYGIHDEFWKTTVLQMASTKPAMRHALTAISTVFEMSLFHEQSPAKTLSKIGQNPLATAEYNKAIRHMIDGDDDQVALLVCMIFVSLEIIQENRIAAVDHCRHGVLIMNNTRTVSPWVRDKILPTMRRLAVFPYFFGGAANSFEKNSFPALSEAFHPSDRFNSLDDAVASMDYWTARAIRLIRKADPYRIPAGCDVGLPEEDYTDPFRGGPLSGTPIPDDMRTEQRMVLKQLSCWQDGMDDYLKLAAATAVPIDGEDLSTSLLLQMRCLISQVWLTAQYIPDDGEMAFDQHMDLFRKIVKLGYAMRASREGISSGKQRPTNTTEPSSRFRSSEAGKKAFPTQSSFASEMGVLPILFFTTMRCRDLELRLEALSLLWDLSTAREGLFQIDRMAHIARRFVELEHNVDLTRWRWRDGGDAVREFRHAAFRDNPHVWSHDPLVAVPGRMRLWDAIDPILMKAVFGNDGQGLVKKQAPPRGRTVRFIRYRDGKLERWEENLSI